MWSRILAVAIACILLITVTGTVLADNQQATAATPTNQNVTLTTDNQATSSSQSAQTTPSSDSATASVDQAASTTQQTGGSTFWYLTRATALTGYVLLFVNVCLGLGLRVHFLDELLARWKVLDLHEFTSLLGLGFVAIHLASLLGDQSIGFTLSQILVPFTSAYRMPWVTLGVIAFYLSVAITASCYIRPRLGQRTWKLWHYAGYGAYFMALFHGILAGSDAGQPWAAALYWGTGTVVAVLTIGRFWEPLERHLQNSRA